jgi:4-hydroxybenzoate polyprenyltransferase
MTEKKEQSSKASVLFKLFRFERSLIAAIITGSAAFAAGARTGHALWLALAGWCIAVGGFSLITFIGRKSGEKDQEVSSSSLILVYSLFFIAVSFLVTILVNPRALIPWSIILLLVISMSLPLFAKPLVRTFILGLLHALLLLMGNTAGSLNLSVIMLAAVLLFAILGGKGILDISNWEQDMMTGKKTLVTTFKLSGTVKLAILCFILAYSGAIGAFFVGNFNHLYLYPAAILVAAGLVCIFLFIKQTGPEMARKLTPFFNTGTLFLVCLAMILGAL